MKKRPTILMHVCCAPCSTYTLEYLTKYADVTIYFANSNIHPKAEYQKRATRSTTDVHENGWSFFIFFPNLNHLLHDTVIVDLFDWDSSCLEFLLHQSCSSPFSSCYFITRRLFGQIGFRALFSFLSPDLIACPSFRLIINIG